MKRVLWYIVLIHLVFTGCEQVYEHPGGGLEIYLLEDFETFKNSRVIITGSVTMKEYPIVEYSDIISYNSRIHAFKIIESKKNELHEIPWPVSGTGFALTVNKEIIYTGYFWPGYSSASCDWIIIDPTMYLHFYSELRVELGYPFELEDLLLRDPRNDERILGFLERDNKLIQ